LGKNGIWLLQKAKGIDDSPIVPYQEQKSIGTQTTFKNDSIDLVAINYLLTAMVMELAFSLRQKQSKPLVLLLPFAIRRARMSPNRQRSPIPR
jgi:DNA polymerase-4